VWAAALAARAVLFDLDIRAVPANRRRISLRKKKRLLAPENHIKSIPEISGCGPYAGEVQLI
jgi:hypothetical protein